MIELINKFNSRSLNLLGCLACAGMMAYALYAQHFLFLDPCPLCVIQRIAVITTGIIFLFAFIQKPRLWGRLTYAALITVSAGIGAGVSAWHVWLQNLPSDKIPSCGPGFDYIISSFPIGEAFSLIFSGSGECATTDWKLLSLSMPSWVFISCFALIAIGLQANLKAKI